VRESTALKPTAKRNRRAPSRSVLKRARASSAGADDTGRLQPERTCWYRIRSHTTFASVREPYLVEQSSYCDLLRQPLTAGCTRPKGLIATAKKSRDRHCVDAAVLSKKKTIPNCRRVSLFENARQS
jgi:hypothetical protein